MQLDVLPIIEAGAAHRVRIDSKTEGTHQVQGATGGRREPRDVPGVGGNFGFDQHDVQRSVHGTRAQSVGFLGEHAAA